MRIELLSTFINIRVISQDRNACSLDARYQKSTSYLMFSLVNRHRITKTVFANRNWYRVIATNFIIGNQYRMILIAIAIENQCPQSRGKVLCALSEKWWKWNLQFYPLVTIFHHNLSFPTVFKLKLLQYRPPDLRWATIVVVMQITVVKAKSKLQQNFACYQFAHYLVANY